MATLEVLPRPTPEERAETPVAVDVDEELAAEIREFVGARIGKLARPSRVVFTEDLPKTRSGKIMRRLLRDIAEGKALGDTTTLADPNVVARLKSEYEEKEQ